MRSLLVVYDPAARPAANRETPSAERTPEAVLESAGYRVMAAFAPEQARIGLAKADAAVLDLPVTEFKAWSMRLLADKRLPLLWWCSDSAASQSLDACEDDVRVDGILTPRMADYECHWALHFGAKRFYEREQWLEERRQLTAKVEERKWIDKAKGILCEIKNINETEAYEMLRTQAMNERKRMVDVATSIVKVYELLQESKPKGAKRR
ncbi:ANTAR domain-containing response regulator [Cohnella caldifontis]|uniref:ANTAR domain-containing response regulator n=1 Tax=Cohnella caldifontis TaxID=3027471 RepID=UPI0023EC6424|nr:ANTAR domain-containing protein [Cohnella sp. YIM B05605]